MSGFFLISNMFPTKENPGYGIFVKNISDALCNYGIKESCKAVLLGRSKGGLNKVFKYLSFYFQIFIKFWNKYDFIYIHFPNHAVPILYPLLKLRRKNIIVNFHGEDLLYDVRGYTGKLGKLMEKTCKEFASAIVVPSSYFKEIVINKNLITKNKIIVSPSGGINEKIFFKKDSNLTSPNSLNIGYVGRLESDKGIYEYLETCKRLKDYGIGFTGLIIGYGSEYDYTNLFLKENGLTSQINIIEGIAQCKLGNLYRKMDLLIFSSSRKSESLGLTGIEAMACGTPVIGSNIGGIATYIKHGYNGWLTPIHNIDAIISAIFDYISMSVKDREKMKKNCIETGRLYYSTKVAKNLANEFKKLKLSTNQ